MREPYPNTHRSVRSSVIATGLPSTCPVRRLAATKAQLKPRGSTGRPRAGWETTMAEAAAPADARRSRLWLYTPFVLLALVAIAWSVAWMVIRDRTSEGLDAWIAAEARNGRRWTCADRTVAGYPFRIEVTCATVALRQSDATASLGRVHAVAQVYQPRHVISRIEGPLRLTRGAVALEGGWRLLETSIRGSAGGLQRASLVAEAPAFQVTGPG